MIVVDMIYQTSLYLVLSPFHALKHQPHHILSAFHIPNI